MTLEKVIEMLESEYDRAKRLPYVRKPLAFALYRVWKKADGQEDEPLVTCSGSYHVERCPLNTAQNQGNRAIYADILREEIAALKVTTTGLRSGKGILEKILAEYRERILQIIDYLPTVEIRKVVHGTWERTGDWEMDEIYGGRKCSVCGYEYCGNLTKYCSECGSKMDGDGNA